MLIAYVGKERCDIVYYISKISNALNEKTLIVDNSICGDLFRALTDNSRETVRECNGYTLARNLKVSKKEIDAYENVILYHGLSDFGERYDVIPDYMYVAVSMNRLEMFDAGRAIQTSGLENATRKTLVVVDNVQRKYSLQSIAEEIGIVPTNGYILPLDERDQRKYQMLVNTGSVSMKKASDDMTEVVKDAMELIFKIEPRKAKKIAARL